MAVEKCTVCRAEIPEGDWLCSFCTWTVGQPPKPEDCVAEDSIVSNPSHYARWSIEPITYIMRNGMEFWRGNVIKYASRAGFKMYEGKTQEESEILDLEKVKRYCEMRINQIKGEEIL